MCENRLLLCKNYEKINVEVYVIVYVLQLKADPETNRKMLLIQGERWSEHNETLIASLLLNKL